MILFNHTWTWCGSSRRLRDTMRLCTNLEAFYGYSDPSSYPVGNCPWIAFWDLGNTSSNLARCPLANLMGICIPMNLKTFSFVHYCIFRFFHATRNFIVVKTHQNRGEAKRKYPAPLMAAQLFPIRAEQFFAINTRFHNNRFHSHFQNILNCQ